MIRYLSITAIFLFTALPFAAQDLPNSIRGYKVYRPRVERTASIRSAEPASLQGSKLVSISPLGVTFEAAMRVSPMPYDGRIDFLAFHDFTVNGVPVEIEEYLTPFGIKKYQPVVFPRPASVFLSTPRLAQAAWIEMRDSRPEWLVKGRVFVFGRFKKYGMTFKRVVPVDVAFMVDNPIAK